MLTEKNKSIRKEKSAYWFNQITSLLFKSQDETRAHNLIFTRLELYHTLLKSKVMV